MTASVGWAKRSVPTINLIATQYGRNGVVELVEVSVGMQGRGVEDARGAPPDRQGGRSSERDL